jgi:hypothetical protein
METTMKTLPTVLGLIAVSAAALAVAGPSQAASQCFRISDMGGWRVTPDAQTMYMRMRTRDVYEVRLRGACPSLRRIGVHLVHKVTSDTVCTPLDFDLRVADAGVPMPAIMCPVASYRRLSPAEAAALPPKLKP